MSTTAQKPLPIIHLNGFPGTGKLTVAKCLQKMLGPHGRLVHNHLLINPADAVLHRTEPGYQDLRRAIRSAVFSSLAQSAATHAFAYLFTDFQSSDPVGSATCAEYLDAARARGCDEAANVERLVTSERRAHGKIVDRELLGKFRSGVDIHRFDGPDHASMELDVTELSAEEAAHRILQHVFKTCPEVERAVEGGKTS
ncbi:hypothetical protein H634G_08363 [Metarhizium anisopliae BRIP 53293]|uniref:Uncharacterized protein n=1 Tax=Metarhizium anisopliae BRIP 53293 TaxID=1291518 RepID=A0A0D9NRA0_METAN|nr:hypothetical protein H634G_08363 [Metarhizium anisopliae BRIP 53293]